MYAFRLLPGINTDHAAVLRLSRSERWLLVSDPSPELKAVTESYAIATSDGESEFWWTTPDLADMMCSAPVHSIGELKLHRQPSRGETHQGTQRLHCFYRRIEYTTLTI